MKIIQIFFVTFLFLIPKLSAEVNHYDFLYKTIYSSLIVTHKIENFNDMEFCPTVLKPTTDTLQKSIEAIIRNPEQNTNSTENGNIDSCCRTLYLCGVQKKTSLNDTKKSNIRHCECENGFLRCLEKLNDEATREFALPYSFEQSTCVKESYPIVKCVKFHKFFEPRAIFYRPPNAIEQESHYIRCLEYEFDESKPKIYQKFDLPYIFKIGKYEHFEEAERLFTKFSTAQSDIAECIKHSTDRCIKRT
ncbi:uncharacterized protein LOC116351829 [Contarinia nasturtii]|uniref:uncharacterized protein LOC116351829 n=1 Tax=Contarinia nasturtii TaxID=265458 RepID=UPI0012D452C5|nr:uncharacterized protein LOC116351829 [Contarinia nasturtii]